MRRLLTVELLSHKVYLIDFCSGNQNSVGPNGSLLSIMTETGFQEDGLLFEGTSYWVNVSREAFVFLIIAIAE